MVSQRATAVASPLIYPGEVRARLAAALG